MQYLHTTLKSTDTSFDGCTGSRTNRPGPPVESRREISAFMENDEGRKKRDVGRGTTSRHLVLGFLPARVKLCGLVLIHHGRVPRTGKPLGTWSAWVLLLIPVHR